MTNHIRFDVDKNILYLLDQRALPNVENFIACENYRDVIKAIKTMVVRGAPAIGVAAAWGCVLAAEEFKYDSKGLKNALTELRNARPTAVNLAWAVDRMEAIGGDGSDLAALWRKEAQILQDEDIAICKKIGKNGAHLINDGDTVLTHCNAGALATAGYGTALGVIRAAYEENKNISVIADETRPLLQGARLTAYELAKSGIPVKIICDDACATIMRRGLCQIVITGADRIAANGDAANKIGTLGVAIMANYFKIPFYIAAPLSTIDTTLANGSLIPIEERDSCEVTEISGALIAPQGVTALNFAFDVTPADLIAGIITEDGILRKPYTDSIRKAFTSQ